MLGLQLTVAAAGRILILSSQAQAPVAIAEGLSGSELTSFSLFIDSEIGVTATNNSIFIDSSENNFQLSSSSTFLMNQGSFSPYNSGWCAYFHGNTGNPVTFGSVSSFNFLHTSATKFTIEFWMYPETNPFYAKATLLDNCQQAVGNRGVSLMFNQTSNTLEFSIANASANYALLTTSTSSIPLNTWTHVAISYDDSLASNQSKIYVNGILNSTKSRSSSLVSSGNAAYIMSAGIIANVPGSNFYPLHSKVSDLRISNSIIYTGDFTLPRVPLVASTVTQLLTFQHQDNRFKDNSQNNFTLTNSFSSYIEPASPYIFSLYTSATNGSSFFTGNSNQYISTPSTSSFVFGTGNFTIEAWVYAKNGSGFSAESNDHTIISGLSTVNRNFYIADSGNKLGFSTASSSILLSRNAVPINQWSHVACVRNGNVLTLYINGVADTSSAYTANLTLQEQLRIGIGRNLSTSKFQGHMSDLRIVKGVAAYTTNFAPPSGPMAAISGTNLLLKFDNAAIIDKTGRSTISIDNRSSASTGLSTGVKKNGNASLRFAANNYMTIRQSLFFPINYRGGDFTIEFWANFITFENATRLVSFDNNGTVSTTPLLIQTDTAGNKIGLFLTSAGGSWDIADNVTILSGRPTLNTWYHLAVSRKGNTFRTFANGTVVSTFTSTSNVRYQTTYELTVGNINGYIDDFRSYRGYAKYTSNFTPE